MFIKLAVLVGTMALGDTGTPSTVHPSEFEGWFRSAVEGDLEVPDAIAKKARSFRYVFVGGFRNERMPGYFAQNMAELRALGVPRSRIHLIRPSSSRDSDGNIEDVQARFLEIAEEGPEKIVVIAHSRGACDALAFALGHASFVEERVEALFLIQGPFGGSGVAEYLVGDGPSMDRQMKLKYRVIGSLLGRLARLAMKRSGAEAVEGMTRSASKAFWDRILKKYEEAVAKVGPKTFYVRSVTDPSDLRFARRAVAWYVQIYHGPGDGLVAVVDQALPGVGTVIATIQAGHADLTQKYPATRTSRELRRALTRSIVMAVGQPRGSESNALKVSPDIRSHGGPDLLEDPIPEAKAGVERHHRRKFRIFPPKRVVAADR